MRKKCICVWHYQIGVGRKIGRRKQDWNKRLNITGDKLKLDKTCSIGPFHFLSVPPLWKAPMFEKKIHGITYG